jgi:crotonobetainyl-CoA:carnitine CoA-transferase CaiB-like acyl-CoA transferase
MLPFPVHFQGEALPEPSRAPSPGEHTEGVLREVLGYEEGRIRKLRGSGALG